MNLYAGKAAVNARLEPLVDRLARAGVTPDAVTLAAIPIGALGGVAIVASPQAAGLLLLVPLAVALRITLNLIDGNMARRTGQIHPRGELYNEVGDRLVDIALLGAPATLPGAPSALILLGVLGAVLASYIGITARAAGAERIYRGILSKPGRMALLILCSLWAVAAPDPLPWTVFGWALFVGTLLTIVERLRIAIRTLP